MKPGTAFRRWELMGARQTSLPLILRAPALFPSGLLFVRLGPPKLSHAMPDDWSHEETNDPLYADQRGPLVAVPPVNGTFVTLLVCVDETTRVKRIG